MSSRSGLSGSAEALAREYDCALLDLDGVVYRGANAIDGVPNLLRRARELGMRLAFVTNNAARTPQAIAEQLDDIGVPGAPEDVVTSAQAAAHELAIRLDPGARVLVVGGEGLAEALREQGLTPVSSRADAPVAVVQGFYPDLDWHQLAEAAYAVAGGCLWIASNPDLTMPTADGIAPGNGALVNAVAAAAARRPDLVAGKPFRPLFAEAVRRTGARRPLVVGDRLDTDIAGANRSGLDSLLVLTGVTDLAALCSARRAQRPTYLSWTLDGLLAPHQVPARHDEVWQLDDWSVRVRDGVLELTSTGSDRSVGLRAIAAAAWDWADQRAESADDRLDLASIADAITPP